MFGGAAAGQRQGIGGDTSVDIDGGTGNGGAGAGAGGAGGGGGGGAGSGAGLGGERRLLCLARVGVRPLMHWLALRACCPG